MRMCTMRARCSRTRICTGIDNRANHAASTFNRRVRPHGIFQMAGGSVLRRRFRALGTTTSPQRGPARSSRRFGRSARPGPDRLRFQSLRQRLAAEDRFRPLESNLYDNGSPQKIVSVHLNQTDGPSALVILFDLLNSSFSSRGEIWEVMKRSLAHLPSAGNLYLYLLVDDGSLYPVHPLGSPEGAAD